MSWNMLGHDWAVQLLKKQITQENLRHAYLFTGPHGVGRRTLALRVTQALNCPEPAGPAEPCLVCRACRQIERMEYPDLSVVQAEQRGGTLKVDQIRELHHSLALAPYQARYRVALLLRFEEANASAANALLKALEEPPPQVVLILTAESGERLLPTIVSRCEVLRLRPLPLHVVEEGLRVTWGLSADRARVLAHISGGRPGYALRLERESEAMAQRQNCLDELFRLLSSSRVERFAYAESISQDKESLRNILLIWLSYWRDVLLRVSGAAAPVANLDREQEIDTIAARLDLKAVRNTVAAIERIYNLLDSNVNTRLAADVLLLDLPRM